MAKRNGSEFKLYVMDGNPAVEKLITEQTSMSISRTTATIDVTSKDNKGYEEFLGGLKSGEVSMELIMDAEVVGQADKVNYQEMSGFEATRAIKEYHAKLPGDTKTLVVVFKGLITKFDVSAPMEDKVTVSITIKRSGAPSESFIPNA